MYHVLLSLHILETCFVCLFLFFLPEALLPYIFLKYLTVALACVGQWIEHWPANQKVTGSVPSQRTCLGYGPGLQLGT